MSVAAIRLRKQNLEMLQTVPPEYDIPASSRDVRLIHKQWRECPHPYIAQWMTPWGQMPRTDRCGARSENVPNRCMDGRSKHGSSGFYFGEVSKLAAVVHRNGLEDFRKVFAIFNTKGIHGFHYRLTGFTGGTDGNVVLRLFLQKGEYNRFFPGTLSNNSVTFPVTLLNTKGRQSPDVQKCLFRKASCSLEPCVFGCCASTLPEGQEV